MTVLAVALGILGVACSTIIVCSAFAIAALPRHRKLEVVPTASFDKEPHPRPDRRIRALTGPASGVRGREGRGGDRRRLRVPPPRAA
jgi:hypothetical protein